MRTILLFTAVSSQIHLSKFLHSFDLNIRIHSETNIFRYDENITFATQELMPCIDSYRDAHARCEPYPDETPTGHTAFPSKHHPFDPDWRQTVSVAYSLADGPAARTHAIQASLRPYRPQYYHFWQLKTFWHETKITDEDIEVHSFEGATQRLALYDSRVQCLITTIFVYIHERDGNCTSHGSGSNLQDRNDGSHGDESFPRVLH